MSPKDARHQLAAEILAALDDGWTVYAAPPDGQVRAPSVVIAPRAPYRVRGTVCDEQVLIRATILVQRVRGTEGLDELDDLATTVRQAVHASTIMANVDEISDVGPVTTEGDVEYLSAALNITMEVDR